MLLQIEGPKPTATTATTPPPPPPPPTTSSSTAAAATADSNRNNSSSSKQQQQQRHRQRQQHHQQQQRQQQLQQPPTATTYSNYSNYSNFSNNNSSKNTKTWTPSLKLQSLSQKPLSRHLNESAQTPNPVNPSPRSHICSGVGLTIYTFRSKRDFSFLGADAWAASSLSYGAFKRTDTKGCACLCCIVVCFVAKGFLTSVLSETPRGGCLSRKI